MSSATVCSLLTRGSWKTAAPLAGLTLVVGMANPFVSAPLREHGLARVAWSARGFDALASDPRAVVARIERNLAPGAIVLLHEGARHGRNVDTLALLLQRLDALGYGTVMPEELEGEAADPVTGLRGEEPSL